MNLLGFLAPLADIGKTWLNNKKEVAIAKHQRELSTIENNADWEARMATASQTSWKDEWFTILLSLPIIAIMYGVAKGDTTIIDRVNEGFAVLSTLPKWYQYLLGLAVTASFGIKGYNMVKNKTGDE